VVAGQRTQTAELIAQKVMPRVSGAAMAGLVA
jgi:hypothetical protein